MNSLSQKKKEYLKRNLILYLFLAPTILYFILFHYAPIYGLIIAFKDYSPFIGVLKSPWAAQNGFDHFIKFFRSIYFGRLMTNTFLLSFYSLIFGFPVPIFLALAFNEFKSTKLRNIYQTFSYIPHFLSVVVVCGFIVMFTTTDTGLFNKVFVWLGLPQQRFLQDPAWFRTIYVTSGIWQGAGWASIIYYSALSSLSYTLYEAAEIDGANRYQKMFYISLPGMAPTIITIMLLNLGNLFAVGFEKVFLLYTPITYVTSDVLSTYVYRSGFVNQEYSFASAVGLFNSIIRLLLLVLFNYLAKKTVHESLW
jgi:putative aldouronate transport system permease protein